MENGGTDFFLSSLQLLKLFNLCTVDLTYHNITVYHDFFTIILIKTLLVSNTTLFSDNRW